MSHWQYLASNKASGGYGMAMMKQFLATWLSQARRDQRKKGWPSRLHSRKCSGPECIHTKALH